MLKWFHNLKVAHKLALISFAFMVPDSVMLYLFITSINETIQFARLEQDGTQYQRSLERLLDLIPQQRLDARRAATEPAAAMRLAARATAIDAAFDAAAAVDARLGKTLDFTPEGLAARQRQGCDIASVRVEWQAANALPATAERDARFVTLIAHVRAMIAHSGDMSNLILDPDLDSYYLMDATLMALPQTQDRLAQVMADGEDVLTADDADVARRGRETLAIDVAFLKADDLDRITTSTNTALTSGNPLYGPHASLHARVPSALANYVAAAERFDAMTGRLQRGDANVTRDAFLRAGDDARAGAMAFWSVANDELDLLLQARRNYYVYRRTRSLGVSACALMAAASLVMFITRSISGPLKRQASDLQAINGELNVARAQLEDRVAQSRAALARTEQKYRKIVENAVMGIYQLTPAGVFHSANDAMAKTFGYASADELVRNDAAANRALFADPDTRALFEHLMDARGSVVDFQSEIRCRDGSVRWVSENARAVRDERGAILYYEGTVQDVTQRKRAEAEEIRARMEAEAARVAAEAARVAAVAASTAKGDFLATMSHEIRTPLNGVTGMADLLAHTPLNALQSRYVKIIQSSSDGLLAIINQILDFSKIEAGKLELCERDFDVRCAVEEVVVILAQKAANKGLELACQVDPRVPDRVRGDDDRLRQVLMNIVNNAIKFTARGEVVVRVAPDDLTDNAAAGDLGRIRFSVTDTGPGIPPDRLGRLFKSFSQVDSSTTREFGGTGLGLAISKQLSELMGGRIGVESTPGVGSTFWFTVRMATSAADADTAAAVPAPFRLAGRRMLVVDDSVTQCVVLCEQLRAWGVTTSYSASADAAHVTLAAAAAEGRPFDVAIVDVNMPGTTGIEFADAAARRPATATLPMILMSGFDAVACVEDGGLRQFMTKPIRQSNLFDAIMRALASATTPIASPPPATIEASPAPAAAVEAVARSSIARRAARILLAEDMEVNQFVVTETLARAGYACTIANNGREAVAAATTRAFDVVLMDCQMPEMSGFEAASAIRAHEQANRTPRVAIVALTANAVKGDRERCLAAGMDDYLTKPLDPTILIQTLDRLAPTPIDEAETETVGAPAQLPPSALPSAAIVDSSIVDVDALLARCDGDRSMMIRLISMFDTKGRQLWDELRASQAAGDVPRTARIAHSLKGTAANLSATQVAAIAGRLEEGAKLSDLVAVEKSFGELGEALARCREAFAKAETIRSAA